MYYQYQKGTGIIASGVGKELPQPNFGNTEIKPELITTTKLVNVIDDDGKSVAKNVDEQIVSSNQIFDEKKEAWTLYTEVEWSEKMKDIVKNGSIDFDVISVVSTLLNQIAIHEIEIKQLKAGN